MTGAAYRAREAALVSLLPARGLADGIHPLVVIQPGRPHPYGLQGHLAELLSYGVGPVDLSGAIPPPRLTGWRMRCEHGRLTAPMRRGA